MAAPPAEPSFGAGPPPAPPPGPGFAQRRFNFLIVGLTIVLAVGLVGGLLIFANRSGTVRPTDRGVDEVRNAYMTYYAAVGQAYKQLDLASLRPYVTDAGFKQEQPVMQQAVGSLHRYQLTAEHDLQVVVYASGDAASVDDVMLRHTVALDTATLTPVAADVPEVVHESYAFVKRDGRWLVDSVGAFGSGATVGNLPVSYAALSRGSPLRPDIRGPIEKAYLRYWEASKTSFARQDPKILVEVEEDPELAKDSSVVDMWARQGLRYQVQVEHNYRIALKDAATAYVYDTTRDSSYLVTVATGKRAPSTPPETLPKTYELKSVNGNWIVDLVSLV